MASEAEWAWAAGLFEGEGCIKHYTYTRARGNVETYRELALITTDLDVLERFQWVVGDVGRIIEKKTAKVKPHYKDQYYWQVSYWPDVEHILMQFLPHLGARRFEAANNLLANPPQRLLARRT